MGIHFGGTRGLDAILMEVAASRRRFNPVDIAVLQSLFEKIT